MILQNKDYDNRIQNLENLKTEFENSGKQQNADSWECCSAAAGMAEVASDDITVELVFKRADRAMYEDKKKFKEIHGSYR